MHCPDMEMPANSRGAKRQRARSTVKGLDNFLALEP